MTLGYKLVVFFFSIYLLGKVIRLMTAGFVFFSFFSSPRELNSPGLLAPDI